jgi:hypothetical protein
MNKSRVGRTLARALGTGLLCDITRLGVGPLSTIPFVAIE